MFFTQKVRNISRRLLQMYGSRGAKRNMWDLEFSRGRWDFIESTPGDCVYRHVEEYANNGSILDLGCGSGNTGNELDETKYRQYTGVDISSVAIEKARRRTTENGRSDRNRYAQSDFSSFVPSQQYNVILFKESIYYASRGKIKAMLNRYSRYLKEGGVFIVKMRCDGGKNKPIVDTIESHFKVVEKSSYPPVTEVIVFRPGKGLES